MSSSLKNTVRIALVGDGSVGKTSLQKVIHAANLDEGHNLRGTNAFPTIYRQTIGTDWATKTLVLRGNNISMTLTDIGGQSLQSSLLPHYLGGVNAVILCYDVTNNESFHNLVDWLDRIQTAFEKHNKASITKTKQTSLIIYICGNKSDLYDRIQVSEDDHIRFIQDNNLDGGTRVSAKSGDAVNRMFIDIVARAIGSPMSPTELDCYNTVVKANITKSDETSETRTEYIKRIEAEDLAAEQNSRRRKYKRRCVIL